MKKNKLIVSLVVILALVVFIALYFIYKYSEPNILSQNNKKWIQENSSKIIDIAVLNDIPLYGNDGDGIIFDYLDYFTEQSGLDFNKTPYLNESTSPKLDYRFEVKDGSQELSSKELLIYTDYYVAIGKQDIIYDDLKELSKFTIGVISNDSSNVNYYLNSLENIKVKNYDDYTKLFAALESNEINLAIAPNIINLNYTINGNYHINYFFNEINKNIVLTLDDNSTELNDIFIKTYNKWFKDNYNKVYNERLLDYYVSKNQINDKTKADLLSKTYVYGYVENAPYEFKSAGTMMGISIEYINRLVRLTDIDIDYVEYSSYGELKKAIEQGNVDIYFDYIGKKDTKYLESKSVFQEKYVVLSKDLSTKIDTLESLKGYNVNMIKNNYIYNYINDNSMAVITDYDNIEKINENDNLVIVDKEMYYYYKNNIFKDYYVLSENGITSDYKFMIKSDNDSFFRLFNYIINTNSYYNFRNAAYQELNSSIFTRVTFEELYLLILGIILIPAFIIGIIVVIIKNKKNVKGIKRDERKKYIDVLTSLKNRNYLNISIDKWNKNKTYPQAIVLIDLNNLKHINDTYGREKGDQVIVKAASILVNSQLEKSEIIRSDGNEFLIYMVGYNENQVDVYTKKLAKVLKGLPYEYGAAVGYSIISDNIKTIDDAINEATIDMQSNKETNK